MMDMAHELRMPARQVGSVVFASPHSGRAYPDEFLRRSVLGPRQIRSSEDAFVDLLFADVPDFGAPLLLAHAPRAYIDLNRSCDELDPALVEGLTRRSQSPRIASGLGVVPRVVAGGRAIINGKITLAEAEARIRACWQPYHAALERLMEDTSRQFGEAILLDCHSMPSEAIAGIRARDGAQPDIVLGDRYGSATWMKRASCPARASRACVNVFVRSFQSSWPSAGMKATSPLSNPFPFSPVFGFQCCFSSLRHLAIAIVSLVDFLLNSEFRSSLALSLLPFRARSRTRPAVL